MSKYILKEVKTRADERVWLKVVRSIYKGYDKWVYPLDSDICAVFDPARNKKFAHGEAIRWYVIDSESGKAVGRIAAFYDRDAEEDYEQQQPRVLPALQQWLCQPRARLQSQPRVLCALCPRIVINEL